MTLRAILSAMFHPATLAEWKRCWPIVVIVGVFFVLLAAVGPEKW